MTIKPIWILISDTDRLNFMTLNLVHDYLNKIGKIVSYNGIKDHTHKAVLLMPDGSTNKFTIKKSSIEVGNV